MRGNSVDFGQFGLKSLERTWLTARQIEAARIAMTRHVKRGGKVSFEPRGPSVIFEALDPSIRKWYIPQELYGEYQWQNWQYANYGRENYQRYVLHC